ncbi:hypothetical protein N7481_013455 [Penicillium waksmanii]|uniref:uncharacterized protein n=1 Tax=Penicillium waksmanii TaxID=69791 RepID=UPI002547D4D0|nr:uncharacterized protein N7481_013455 [Penicillium waksmanii]KAJ5963150.1 hypothetical protein N7481_013455 [Penicillium waksmanii]
MACPPLGAFQIGWICTLPIEAAAAAEMLDEKFGILEEQDAADSNTYTLGRIGKHHVVIACLPGGQYGTTSATTVANNMIRTFSKSLRIGLMVGIGGGIPSAAHDIRLGDVVISYPQGTFGGVIQYDMGKVIAGGGNLNEPAKQDHPANGNSCDECPAEWEETRSEREDSDPQPHYGIIASGNAVIKHGWTREQLRLETGALCFEMEAAGLMMDFPCIVIRGVCDYADSHKNKQWQGYAALAAASYTKELLGYVPLGHISQEELVVDICNGFRNEIQGTNQRLDRAYDQQEQHHCEGVNRASADEQKRCHQALKTANYEEQKNINPKRAEGTCQWALQSPEYIRWSKSNSNDLLWVSADPGCGKSVLARSIVDDYLKASDLAVTICYFFFKDNDEQNHLATALCSVLHQLFTQRPHLLSHATPSWERNGDKLRQEINELWRIFLAATSADKHFTICILDALDECLEIDQDRLIQKLQSFYHPTNSSTQDTCLKFLVTSRPYDRIQDHFKAITDSFPHIHIKGEEENDRIHEEIDLVVKIRVRELAETVPLSPDMQLQVEERLLQMEHRTYLWLYLAINDIRTTFKHSLRPTWNSITLIPPSVNAAYEKILCRVPNDQKDIVRKILVIIVAARRPLTIQEMAMALGIGTCVESRTTVQAGLDPVHLDRKLRQLCCLFIFTRNQKIYLIHQTAREFLIKKKSSDNCNFAYWSSLSDAEDLMAHICLRYLLMEDLDDDEADSRSYTRDLLEYSAVYWGDHVQKVALTSDKEMSDLLQRVYEMSEKRFALWFEIFWEAFRPFEKKPPRMKALHLAALNGHEQMVHFFLDAEQNDMNRADDISTYPLIWASLNGHEKVVQMLLERGADINACGGRYGNTLRAACSEGHDRIVQILLERGADINAHGGGYGDALRAACSEGYDKIVQMLLEQGADINAEGGVYGNALQDACFGGHDKIVQILLERGADVNAYGGGYGNSLQAASFGGYDKIVQMLLERGAGVNAQGGIYGNALQAASSEGQIKVVQILLERGADVNAHGGNYGSSLEAACSEGHDEIVQMLIERGAVDIKC